MHQCPCLVALEDMEVVRSLAAVARAQLEALQEIELVRLMAAVCWGKSAIGQEGMWAGESAYAVGCGRGSLPLDMLISIASAEKQTMLRDFLFRTAITVELLAEETQ